MLIQKLFTRSLSICPVVFAIAAIFAGCGICHAVQNDHVALIDPYWVLSANFPVRSHIRLGDSDYPVASSVDLGEVSLLRLSYPITDGSVIQRSYNRNTDSLLGFRNLVGDNVALDNGLINSKIIGDALTENSSPLLEGLPLEIVSRIVASGDPVDWRGVNSQLTGLASEYPTHPEITIRNEEELNDCLCMAKIEHSPPGLGITTDVPLRRVKVMYSATDTQLSSLAEVHPGITDLYLEDCRNILDKDVLSKFPRLRRTILGVGLDSTKNLNKFLASNYPIARVSMRYDQYVDEKFQITDETLCKIVEHCPNLSSLIINSSGSIRGSFLQYLPKSLTKLALSGYRGDFSVFQNLTCLKELYLSGSSIRESDFNSLPKSLVKLELGNTWINNFSALKEFPLLTELDLSYCRGVTNEVFAQLPDNLTKLTLSSAHITSLSGLKKLKCLRELNMTHYYGNLEIENVLLEDFPESLEVLGHDTPYDAGIFQRLKARNPNIEFVYKGRKCFGRSN